MYASTPRMGLMPASSADVWSSYAPNMFPWSVTATASIPVAFTCLIRSLSRFAPSRREYWVWRCRWTKSPDIRPAIVASALASAPVPVPVVVDDTPSLAPTEVSVEGHLRHHPKVVPVAVGVELPHGRDRLRAAKPCQALSAAPAEARKGHEERNVLGHAKAFVVSAEGLEVSLQAERRARVHPRQPHHRHERGIREREAHREPLKPDSCRPADDAARRERTIHLVESLPVHPDVGVHEDEDFSEGRAGSGIAHGADHALFRSHDAGAFRTRDFRCAIRRDVVGHDRLGLPDAPAVRLPRGLHRLEQPGQAFLLVPGRDDDREAHRRHYRGRAGTPSIPADRAPTRGFGAGPSFAPVSEAGAPPGRPGRAGPPRRAR